MIADPEGQRMKAAIRNGVSYGIGVKRDGFLDLFDDADVIFSLLELAHRSDNPVLVDCCRNRLPFLIQQGYGVERMDGMLSPRLIDTDDGDI